MDGTFRFHASTRVPASAGELFEFHADPHNLPKVMPPTLKLVSLNTDGPAEEGRLIELHCREGWLLPLHLTCRWKVVQRPRVLVDEMVRGPFAVFVHEHRFEEDGQDACILHDTVTFLLGRSWWLRLISAILVMPYLSLLFNIVITEPANGRPKSRLPHEAWVNERGICVQRSTSSCRGGFRPFPP